MDSFKSWGVTALAGLLAIALPLTSMAAKKGKSTKFPRGCHNTGFQYDYDNLVLKPSYEKQKRSLFFIKNTARYHIKLKTIKDPNDLFMPEYDHKIPKRQWGVFAMEKPQLDFMCVQMHGKQEVATVNCGDILKICQYDYAKFPYASMGTYWLEKTGSLNQAIRIAIRSGILLRW